MSGINIHRQGRTNHRITLTVDQRKIQKAVHERAEKLRNESDELSIVDAIHIAAFQLGFQGPDDDDLPSRDSASREA